MKTNQLQNFVGIAFLCCCSFLLSSCNVKEYPFRNHSNLTGDKTPVYYTDKYENGHKGIRYQDGRQFSNKLAAVKQNDRWGFIDAEEKVIIPMQYAWLSSFGEFGFHEKLAVAKDKIDKFKMPIFTAAPSYLINDKGERVTPVYGALGPINRKLAMVNNGTKFEGVGKEFSKSDGKWGFINHKGKEVIPCKYDLVYPFHDIISFVQNNGKWGCVNESGKEIIPCKYDEVYYKSDIVDINSPFDLAPPSNMNKKEIAEKKNIIYMVADGMVYLFNTKGKLLSKHAK